MDPSSMRPVAITHYVMAAAGINSYLLHLVLSSKTATLLFAHSHVMIPLSRAAEVIK